LGFQAKETPWRIPIQVQGKIMRPRKFTRGRIDYFETYAPVIQWSTVRLLLTMVLKEWWATRQVECTNAFTQAEMKEEVYVDPPQLFSPRNRTDRVIRVMQSLYGLKHAPKTFYDAIFPGPNADQIARAIEELGVSKYETQHKVQLHDKGEVGDLLGVHI
jgi:hypothetical protein